MRATCGAWFDIDGWPLAFVQSTAVYLSVMRYADSIAWREHRTAAGAVKTAKRDKGIAVQFNGIFGRWETVNV